MFTERHRKCPDVFCSRKQSRAKLTGTELAAYSYICFQIQIRPSHIECMIAHKNSSIFLPPVVTQVSVEFREEALLKSGRVKQPSSHAFVAFAFYALPAVTTTDNHMSSCRIGDTIYQPPSALWFLRTMPLTVTLLRTRKLILASERELLNFVRPVIHRELIRNECLPKRYANRNWG